ncbi:MAG: HpaII family restriction endonuclease [Endomicrobiaceae bacterium]|nr:HpaII family restriction endonuclease [Endomicrobiaceae bacterium]
MSLKGNKGEWSEIYTLLKILSDKELYAGDGDLNKIENLIFPIIRVLREESNGTYEYSYKDNLIVIKNSTEIFHIPILEFKKQAILLLKELLKNKKSAFSIPEIEKFINSFACNSLKAKSSIKSDIRIVIHDKRTLTDQLLGFSIKSQLGMPSTLFNASQSSNFIYKLNKILSDDTITQINSINSKNKIRDRIEAISNKGANLVFKNIENPIFSNNLTLIDSSLPKILGELLIIFNSTKESKLSSLITKIEEKNPINYDMSNNHKFYNYKIKRLLTDIALGMVAGTVWTGKLDATGGYLVVKNNGDILCYHIYNRNEFENYLFDNTKLETPSSSRNNFGKIYKENTSLFFKLNLQIRFIH